MEDDMEAFSSLKINYLDKWALFQSNNGSHASRHGCTQKNKKT
jgi:hypothetical protein